jgi:replicative DNA helicase
MARSRQLIERRQTDNLPAERAVLGSVLRSPHILHSMNGAFRPQIFASERHQQIAAAIKWLDDSNRPVSLEGVIGRLPPVSDDDEPFSVEGYLNTLVHDQATPGIAEDLLSDLIDKAGRRKMAELGRKLAAASMEDDGRDPVEVLEALFDEARGEISSGAVQSVPIGLAMDKAMDIANRRARGEQAVGVPWFMSELDSILGLMEPGHLIGGLADAKAGKSSFGINVLRHAGNFGPVIFFSMEMEEWQVGVRMLSQESRVPEGDIYRGLYTDRQLEAIMEAKARITKLPIEIVDTPRMTIAQMRAKAMEWKRRQGGLAFTLVDQLKVIRSERKFVNQMEAIPEHMVGLKAMGSDLGCPLMVLMQRTRGSLNRPNPRPTSDDGYGGGATLEGVDTMVGIWRKEKWMEERPPADDATQSAKAKWEKEKDEVRGKAEIIALARRYGKPNGSVMCRFVGECALYESLNVAQRQLVSNSAF